MTLDQIYTPRFGNAMDSHWLSVEDIELGVSWKEEWDSYTASLRSIGLNLTNDPDALCWSYNKTDGQVTTRSTYHYIDVST